MSYKSVFNKLFYQIDIELNSRLKDPKYVYQFLKSIENAVDSGEDHLSYVNFSTKRENYTHLDFDNFAKKNYNKVNLVSRLRYGNEKDWPMLYILLNQNEKLAPIISIRSRIDKNDGIRIYLEFQRGIELLFSEV